MSFNPLFIREKLQVPGEVALRRPAGMRSFNPLFIREKLQGQRTRAGLERRPPGFNPLFIREKLQASISTASDIQASKMFQSLIHQGKIARTFGTKLACQYPIEVSIPYSSGKNCKVQSTLQNWHPKAVMFQSLIHQGKIAS